MPLPIEDAGGSLTVDGTVSLSTATLASLETVTTLPPALPTGSSAVVGTLENGTLISSSQGAGVGITSTGVASSRWVVTDFTFTLVMGSAPPAAGARVPIYIHGSSGGGFLWESWLAVPGTVGSMASISVSNVAIVAGINTDVEIAFDTTSALATGLSKTYQALSWSKYRIN